MDAFYSTLTVDYVRSTFHYDPDTGFLYRKNNPDKIAGTLRKDGYVSVKCKSKPQLLHRIVWLHYYGFHVDGFIDHINHAREDNRIVNLRCVTRKQNNENKLSRPKKTLPKGVSFAKDKNKWKASIGSNYKQYHLGFFDSPEKARIAYLEAASKIHTHNQG
jgi:hypothetical protein